MRQNRRDGSQRTGRNFLDDQVNRWIESDAWPLPGIKPDTLKLEKLSESTTIVSDPAHPIEDLYSETSGAHDYRYLERRNDVADEV